MRIKEKYSTIFSEVETLKPTLKIFEMYPSNVVDTYFIMMYGNRVLTEFAKGAETDLIANVLANVNSVKWDNMLDTYFNTVFNTKNRERTEVESHTSDTEGKTVRDNVNKVSAFNEDEFVDNDSNTESTDDTRTITDNTTRTYTNSLSPQDFKLFSDYVRSTNILLVVCADVANTISLCIMGDNYEREEY